MTPRYSVSPWQIAVFHERVSRADARNSRANNVLRTRNYRLN
jgi:hypothetical protein